MYEAFFMDWEDIDTQMIGRAPRHLISMKKLRRSTRSKHRDPIAAALPMMDRRGDTINLKCIDHDAGISTIDICYRQAVLWFAERST